jgi:hypothetical protein
MSPSQSPSEVLAAWHDAVNAGDVEGRVTSIARLESAADIPPA